MGIGVRIAAIASVVLLGCVTIQPSWKFDPDLDLSGRHTFAVAESLEPPSGMSADDARLWTERRDLIQQLIRDDLIAKGYRETQEQPDLLVHFFAGIGLKGMGTDFGTERMGKIDIRVVDPSTGQWLWHGWATETMVERLDENEEIREAVPLILSKFPRAS